MSLHASPPVDDQHNLSMTGRYTAIAATSRLEVEAQAGRISRAIAHDLNNQLTVLWSCLEMLKDALGPHHELGPDIEDALTATQQASELSQWMLMLTRSAQVAPSPTDLYAALEVARPLVELALGKGGQLTMPPARTPAQVVALGSAQVHFIFLSFAELARRACGQHVHLTLEVQQPQPDLVDLVALARGCSEDPWAHDDHRMRLIDEMIFSLGGVITTYDHEDEDGAISRALCLRMPTLLPCAT